MAGKTYGVRYLGSSPTDGTGAPALAPAASLLKIKLQRLQARAVQSQVERKYGPQPFPSPKYMAVAKRLRKAGNDVTKGDRVDVRVTGSDLEIRAKGKTDWLAFAGSDILGCGIVAPGSGKKRTATVAFLTKEAAENLCHVLMCYPNEASSVVQLIQSAQTAAKSSLQAPQPEHRTSSRPQSTLMAGTRESGENETSIMFGVGLSRVSSMRVTHSTRERLSTVCLTGRPAGIKRSSDSYGQSFASIDSAASSPERPSAIERSDSGRSIASDMSEADDEMDGLDESLFSETDRFDCADLEDAGDAFIYAPKDPTLYGFHHVFSSAETTQQFGFPDEA